MRVVLSSDSFGLLDPAQATAELVDGWGGGAPHDELLAVPSSDGGPGMLAAVGALLDGHPFDGFGQEAIESGVGHDRTVWVQASGCAGPGTVGVGRVVDRAVASGVRRVVVGLGGTGAPDGGAGLLTALGVEVPLDLAQLGALTADDLPGLAQVRARLAGLELVAAYDDDRPLLGMAGVAALVAGPDRSRAEVTERALAALARAVVAAAGPALRGDLLSRQTAEQRVTSMPGAGAGGGLGFMLAALGGRLLPGAAVLAQAAGLDGLLAGADLAVVALPTLDWDTAARGVVGHLASRALEIGLPVVALGDEVVVGRRDLAGLGLVGTYETVPGPGRLAAAARRVARTWSPHR